MHLKVFAQLLHKRIKHYICHKWLIYGMPVCNLTKFMNQINYVTYGKMYFMSSTLKQMSVTFLSNVNSTLHFRHKTLNQTLISCMKRTQALSICTHMSQWIHGYPKTTFADRKRRFQKMLLAFINLCMKHIQVTAFCHEILHFVSHNSYGAWN